MDELIRTRDYMAQRGPDDSGHWIAKDGGFGLGHRRLAIIDLSPGGGQPMSWANGRYHIVFNGEIYNYRELRGKLLEEKVVFHSQSDTEVLLALFEREGTAMLDHMRGMYAFAIWDDLQKSLFMARDPYGIKPLYYSVQDGIFRFASQVKALEAGHALSKSIDPAGVVGFLLWGSVPEPHTIRNAIQALPAGHYIIVENGEITGPTPFHFFYEAQDRPCLDVKDALEDSVTSHLVSDVPVAVFLSAGLDSSLIAALACRKLGQALQTFTLKFDEFDNTAFDEAPLAKKIAASLGTYHTERRIRREDFIDIWPKALAAMDQPSIDGFNVFVVSRAAHEAGLKVVLSGLGGDELFGSYPSFRDVPKWHRVASVASHIPGLSKLWPCVARVVRPSQPKLSGFLKFGNTLPGAYFLRRGLFLPEEIPSIIRRDIAKEGLAAYFPIEDASKYIENGRSDRFDSWIATHLMETTQYMRNQLLRDADWASMAHSLELRVPLVDVKLRSQLAALKFEPARSMGKAALVRQIAPELPNELWQRPKSGFSIPVMLWLADDNSRKKSFNWGSDSRALAIRVLKEFIPEAFA